MRYFIPIMVFLMGIGVFSLVLYQINQGRNIQEVPSPLIGKPIPHFELPRLLDRQKTFSSRELKGQVTLVNVWASWCVACRAEHDLLVDLNSHAHIPIVGINYKDQAQDALQWLQELGNPYQVSVYDHNGRLAIDWGVYGVPETFVIDQEGIIRFKSIGPITIEKLQNKILPLIDQLKKTSGAA